MGGLPAMRGEHHRPPAGGGLSLGVLGLAAALVTATILWLSDATVRANDRLDCNAFSSFLDRRHQHAHVQQMLSEATSLPAEAAAPGLQPATASLLGGVAADVMRRVGWRSGVRFARFDASASLEAALSQSARHAGAFLLIVPGRGKPARRAKAAPFLAIHPAAANLTAVLGPAAAALNAAAAALEAALGRRLFPFTLESAPLPACAGGGGPCAVWEASSGRLVLDAGLAGRMAGAEAAAGVVPPPHQPDAAGDAAGESAGGPADEGGQQEDEGAGEAADAVHAAAAAAAEGATGTAGDGGGDLSALLAAFVHRLAEQAADAGTLLRSGKASLPALAAIFARAGATSITLLLASHIPLWFCIVCPLTLGMLAPFLFNFGLTAAAEALCAQMHLPDETCTDLWWGAFAVALMLSLASAVPIVYICRLPECGRRAGAAALAAAARLAPS